MGETRTLITAEQLPEIARDRRGELVRGEFIEMSPVGDEHGTIVIRLGSLLEAYVTPRRLGRIGTEVGFVLRRDPDTVRAPDVSFVTPASAGRRPSKSFLEGAPELAVEVVSPDDRSSAVQEKIREYLEAGVKLVWIVDPQARTVTVYRQTGEARLCSGDDAVTGEDVLPGFSFRPSQLFEY